MRLSGDLSSAIKVTSMREELWMLDDDDGPDEYPYPELHNVFGVHKDTIYRSLRQDRLQRVAHRSQAAIVFRSSAGPQPDPKHCSGIMAQHQ